MKDIRTIFIGTPQFACSVLKALVDESYNLVCVICQPDKPVGRKQEILPTPVHCLADSYQLPFFAPDKLRNAIDEVLAYDPELIITCAYGQIVPDEILAYPKYGCLNIHPSLLPKYRGGAPVHRAIMNGDKQTGVCLMQMVKEMDAGDVYARRVVDITDDMTTQELNIILQEESIKLIQEDLPKYLRGELVEEKQDPTQVTIARNISKEEEFVSLRDDIHVVYNHIRALIDWPIAYGIVDSKRLKFYKASIVVCDHNEEEGLILGFEDDYMKVACQKGILKVYELQLEGKKKMSTKDFKNGLGKEYIGKKFD